MVQVEYLPVIHPTLAEQRSPRAFAERVRIKMAQALNVSVTQHSYEDSSLAMEAIRLKINCGSALLEFGKFEKLYQYSIKDAKQCLAKFLTMDLARK